MIPWQAIIFDMDGLLVDSEPVWHIVEKEIVEARGHRYSDDVYLQLVGMAMNDFLAKLRDIYSLPESLDELSEELIARMLQLIPQKVHAQPGANDLLDYVVRYNIPRAIASSSPIPIIEKTLETRGWGSIFAVRASGEEIEHGKPAPDIYLEAARRLGVNPVWCLALEDSPTGARAAVAAGMTCYAVPDPSHSDKSTFDGITPHVFSSLTDVLKRLTLSE